MRIPLLTFLLLIGGVSEALSQASAPGPLTGRAAEVYAKALEGRYAAQAAKLKPDIVATSDGQTFMLIWRASKTPKRWIVSLHGSLGLATDDLVVWSTLLKDRDVGLICLQWWLGTGEATASYYTPIQIYHEIDLALRRLRVGAGAVMLHGFSRGGANSYAVAALDAGRGQHYFSLFVASSGGVGVDYPPTRAITNGEYGDHPLKGTRWVTAAGQRDPQPDRNGITGMRNAAAWLREQGAIVIDTIEDPDEGHGALQRNPKNAKRVLDLFLNQKR